MCISCAIRVMSSIFATMNAKLSPSAFTAVCSAPGPYTTIIPGAMSFSHQRVPGGAERIAATTKRPSPTVVLASIGNPVVTEVATYSSPATDAIEVGPEPFPVRMAWASMPRSDRA